MLHIVIGYTEKGSQAEPSILYAGRDSAFADSLSTNPPAGIIRTELSRNPVVHRRRVFPENTAAPAPLVLEADPAPARKNGKPAPPPDSTDSPA